MKSLPFQFADPLWLWLTGAALLLFAALLWHAARMRRAQLSSFADPATAADLLRAHSRARRAIKNAVIAAGLLCFGIALARPQWGVTEEQLQRKGDDVVFVLDLSKSMLAQDAQPSRLERAKLAIQDFIYRQPVGRVGLVVFAGSAFLRCPLTTDYSAFEESVMEANPDDLFVPGSDLARGIISAKNAFDKSAERRVVVLITDGEDLEKTGIKAAQEFAKDGLIVFTLGVGTPAGSTVQVPQPTGQLGPLLDQSGQPVISRLDEDTLRAIAEATGGTYRRLDNLSQAMADVGRALRSTELQAATAIKRRGIDRYVWPLAVAILLVVAESFVSTRRRARRAQVA
jgi:Ca-activated chloride channel family protein